MNQPKMLGSHVVNLGGRVVRSMGSGARMPAFESTPCFSLAV